MAISQGREGHGTIFTEINITPLTDIFLVLLIIMMVIAPMFNETNKEIKVPEINAGQSVQDNNVTVEITKEGGIFVNGEKNTADGLTSKLQSLLPSLDKKELIVRADGSTRSTEVLKIFQAASAAGYEKLTIAGEPLSNSRQSELTTDAPSEPDSNSPQPVMEESAPASNVEAPQ
jgi:biopolymer transport protein ExbD